MIVTVLEMKYEILAYKTEEKKDGAIIAKFASEQNANYFMGVMRARNREYTFEVREIG